jgi:hypothetical protein
MPDLIPAQRVPAGWPDERTQAEYLLQLHWERCYTCRPDRDALCPRGRALLAIIQPAGDPDLPGYGLDTYPAL